MIGEMYFMVLFWFVVLLLLLMLFGVEKVDVEMMLFVRV